MDAAALRSQFPVLEHSAYLNAGTDGPLARRAVDAARGELERELENGRTGAHFQRRRDLGDSLRAGYAQALGCDAADVALTSCTSEGLAIVIGGMGLKPGQEILTSDEEHPGLLGALQVARERDGAEVREAPLLELANAVGPRTALVACSHVSWVGGQVAPAELRDLDVPVVFDGAQGLGAVSLDMAELGCDAYAGSGQKWLCGPDGSGALYVHPALRERISVSRRGWSNLADPHAGARSPLHDQGRRYDSMSLSAESLAMARAAIDVFEEAGWADVHARARGLAAEFADRLAASGREVAPRGDTTLVSFTSADAATERARLTDAGVILRDLPGWPYLRASVGAWNDESDLERLIDALER